MRKYNKHPKLKGLSRKQYVYEFHKEQRRIERENRTNWKYKKHPELEGLDRIEYHRQWQNKKRKIDREILRDFQEFTKGGND